MEQRKRTKENIAVFAVLLVITVAMSAFYTVTGVVMPYFLTSYTVGLSQIGLLPSLQSAGETTALLVTGLLVWRKSPGQAVHVIFMGIAAVFILIGLKLFFPVTASLFFALGILNGILNFCCTACIAGLFQAGRSRFITIYFMAQAIGCMIGPLYPSNALGDGLDWGSLYKGFGIAAVLLAALYGTVWHLSKRRHPAAEPAQNKQTASALQLLIKQRDLRMILLCLAIFAYMGHQVALGNWLPTYMTQRLGLDSGLAGVAVSLFSAGMLIGRLLYTALAKLVPGEWYGVAGTAGGGIVLGTGLLLGTAEAMLISVVLTGILAGATSPILIALGCDWFPSHTTEIAALTGLAGALGAAVFSWLIGLAAQMISFEAAISFTVINLFVVAALLAVSVLWKRKSHEKMPEEE